MTVNCVRVGVILLLVKTFHYSSVAYLFFNLGLTKGIGYDTITLHITT